MNFSTNGMAALLSMLLFSMTSQCCNNSICVVTTKKLWQPKWYKLDKIGIFNGRYHHFHTLKQYLDNTVKFRLLDKGENICYGIWQWNTLGWCYSVALESVTLIQLSNTGLKQFIVIYHNAMCSRYSNKQRVLMHGHQGWNVRHGLCHIYMRYVYIYELFITFVSFVVCSLL